MGTTEIRPPPPAAPWILIEEPEFEPPLIPPPPPVIEDPWLQERFFPLLRDFYFSYYL